MKDVAKLRMQSQTSFFCELNWEIPDGALIFNK